MGSKACEAFTNAVPPSTLTNQPSGFSFNSFVPDPSTHAEGLLFFTMSTELDTIKTRIDKLEKRPSLCPTKIYNLNSDEFTLKEPIDVVLKTADNEIIALLPDLEIYGEGVNEIEALLDLKNEIIDLFVDLNSIDDKNLDRLPRNWKKIINSLVEEK